jgi:uncharacterized DUF497 family protein
MRVCAVPPAQCFERARPNWDTRFEYGEERIQVIGMARGDVLFVIVTPRNEDIRRIISARKATRHEQDRYYAGYRETW